jgi:hypothetical protein
VVADVEEIQRRETLPGHVQGLEDGRLVKAHHELAEVALRFAVVWALGSLRGYRRRL